MSKIFKINTCPTCSNEKIRHVVRDITRTNKGKTYTIPEVGFYDCSNCGEKVFDHEAMQKIEAHSPAYHKAEEMVDA